MISRRDFNTRLAGMAAIAAAAGNAPLLGAQKRIDNNPLSPTTLPASPGEDLSPAEQADVESRYQNVIRMWGDRLSREQRERVRRDRIRVDRSSAPLPIAESRDCGPVSAA